MNLKAQAALRVGTVLGNSEGIFTSGCRMPLVPLVLEFVLRWCTATQPLDGVAHTLPRTHRTLGKPWESWGSLLYRFTRSTSLALLN